MSPIQHLEVPSAPKIALITTTINVPKVLAWYRCCSPHVRFFIVGDKKSPHEDITKFLDTLSKPDSFRGPGSWTYFTPEHQEHWKCSDLLGWNTITRRNIALLEALAWGADIIVTIDDDNICLDAAYFDDFERVLSSSFDGIKASSVTDWFDVGSLLVPPASHRGFPHDIISSACFESTTDSKVGVAAGICMGDPDISAITRIAQKPIVHGVSELLRAGLVVDNKTWTVFNSQNTSFLRELAPCFLMIPQFGRCDDIFASLVAQRIMRELDLHVHFGRPFVYQQRNKHDLLKDLKAEQWGAENIREFAKFLDGFTFAANETISERVFVIYDCLQHKDFCPAGVAQLVSAWFDDVGSVL